MNSLGVLHGEVVRITENGFHLSAKALEPLGIYPQSVVWAVLIPAPPSTPPGRPHVVLSPLHPDSWPVAFRLTIDLKDQVGSLAAIADHLNSCDVNILSAECIPRGFQHSSVSILAEDLHMKEELRSCFPSFRAVRATGPAGRGTETDPSLAKHRRNVHGFRQRFNLRIDALANHLSALATHPHNNRATELARHLHRSKEEWLYRKYAPSRSDALSDLCYAYAYSKDAESPFEFRTHVGRNGEGFLESIGERRWIDRIGDVGNESSFHSMAVVDRRGANVRLLIAPARSEPMVPPWTDLHITYRVHFGQQAQQAYRNHTRGVYAAITHHFASANTILPAGCDLLRVANGFYSLSPRGESGWLTLSVRNHSEADVRRLVSPETAASVQRVVEDVLRVSSDGRSGDCSAATVHVSATAPSAPRVFLSRRFADSFADQLASIVKTVAREFGVHLLDGLTDGSEKKTDAILDRIRDADALMLIATDVLESERKVHRWTSIEYGAASGLRMPAALVLDDGPGGRPQSEWQKEYPLHLDQQYFLGELRDQKKAHVVVRRAMEFLSRKILENHLGSGRHGASL